MQYLLNKKFKYNVKDIHFYLLLATSFFIPLSKLFVKVALILLVLNWLLNIKENFSYRLTKRNKAYFFIFISYYLFHLIGLLYSKNIAFGLFDLQIKLPLLLFPLIIFFSKPIAYDELIKISYAFVIGTIIGILICLINATYNLFYTELPYPFYYENLSILFHPSYFALFINFAMLLLTYFSINNVNKVQNVTKLLLFLTLPFYSIFLFLLNSKAGILSLILVVSVGFVYLSFVKKNILFAIIIAIEILVSIGMVSKFMPFLYDRLDEVKREIVASEKKNINNSETVNFESTEVTSTAARINVWKASLEVFSENILFGTGTGDIKDVLLDKYKQRNISNAFIQKLNPHNQFLQTGITFGIVGLIIFVIMFIIPFYYSIRYKDLLLFLFVLLVVFNLMVESMLEVQAGVMFFGFFNSLLFVNINDKRK
ncbi:MAG: hypothetical protein A2X12_10420 [Bacteroidetes bacterium GWE2_29_8]|nr:MAG: hypothetical protein A2X12_10420 [Bacteroidetes bacterium GWE2_29_8]OFY16623.1 MAG: hypothetical protein A2X02_05650 [Bacteroidetes bacterium GWF2_29_10]